MADTDLLADLLSAGEGRYSLAEACLLIAADAYPGLDVNRYLAEIERIAARLRGRLAQGADGEERVVALNQYLFNELGFYGNADDYYDPRNSYLNEVIERRRGIPISLCILYMEVGRKIGLPLEGVSFPGHFLVRLSLRGSTLVLDPFSGGEPLSEQDLRKLLRRVIAGSGSAGLRSASDVAAELPLDQFLEAAGSRQILARVLRNLKNIYREKDEPERQLQVINRMITVAPDAHGELRDRGVLYQKMEAFRAALKDLTDYLEREPEAPDADEVRTRVVELTALCARLN
jgi:regulator of sirC expression with transglutaminase-like and TPR domain